MAKIALIGAGSHVFSKNLITDIISYPELRDSTIALMDIAQEPLDLITAFAKKIVKQNGFNTKIESTTNRREALQGADYVIITIQVGGLKAMFADKEIIDKAVLTKRSPILSAPGEFSTGHGMCRSYWTSVVIWKSYVPMPGF